MADIKISQLGALETMTDTTVFPVTAGDVTVKATAKKMKDYVLEAQAKAVLEVTASTVNSLPTTISNTAITDDMVVVNSVLSNPAVQTGAWTVTTAAGSATISGSISGTTNVTLYLARKA